MYSPSYFKEKDYIGYHKGTNKYYLFGIEVPYEVYHDFQYGKYTVVHDSLGPISGYDLSMIQSYTIGEYAQNYPIQAANAREILNQIREKVTATMNRKDENMKEPKTAADFIAALQEIYNESRRAYNEAQGKLDQAQAAYDAANEAVRKAIHKDPILDARLTVARGELTLAEDERRKAYNYLVNDHDQKVDALREQFVEYLDELYSATPEKLDTATMQLLEAGICKPAELARLAERHANNPTMLRIIGAYARKLRENGKLTYNESVDTARAIGAADAAKDGSRELKIFDSAVSSCRYGLAKTPGHATRMNEHVSGWFDTFREQMNNLPCTPEDGEED